MSSSENKSLMIFFQIRRMFFPPCFYIAVFFFVFSSKYLIINYFKILCKFSGLF